MLMTTGDTLHGSLYQRLRNRNLYGFLYMILSRDSAVAVTPGPFNSMVTVMTSRHIAASPVLMERPALPDLLAHSDPSRCDTVS